MPAYAPDLAFIHDEGYGEYARRCAPGLLNRLEDAGIDSGLVVDLGCGSGIWAKELDAAGYEVLGVDISKDMLAIARRRVPAARFLHQSYLDLRIPDCRAVTALGEIFNYRFDEAARGKTLQQFFRRVHAALEPGGLFMFDVAEPGRGRSARQGHRLTEDWACVVDFDYDDAKHQLTRRIATFRKAGPRYRRNDEQHELQLYPPGKIAQWLRQAGFKARVVRRVGDFPLPECIAGFVARRP